MEKLSDVMRDARLTSSARIAYYWLRATARNGYSYETNAALGEVIGVADDTVSLIARELQAARLVRREPGGKGTGNGKRRWAILGLTAALMFPADTPVSAAYIGDQGNCTLIDTQNGEPPKKRRRRKGSAAEQLAAPAASPAETVAA